MKTVIILTIEHKKPVDDLLDKIACRAYTLDGVDDVTCAFPELRALPVVNDPKELAS